MKIYTKTGDSGESSLFDGRRLKKSDLRFEVYGEFDQLNVMIGDACIEVKGKPTEPYLREIQSNIFSLSSILATEDPANLTDKVKEIDWAKLTERLECNMDFYAEELPELTSFVLPGGARSAIKLHYCRVQTRKCERLLVALSEMADFDENILKFVNRLSDFFFMAARYANFKNKIDELSW